MSSVALSIGEELQCVHAKRTTNMTQERSFTAKNALAEREIYSFSCLSASLGLEEFYLGAFSLMKFMFIY